MGTRQQASPTVFAHLHAGGHSGSHELSKAQREGHDGDGYGDKGWVQQTPGDGHRGTLI